MAISQYRMIALINAGADFEQALARAIHQSNMYWNLASKGQMTWQEAFTLANSILSTAALLSHPQESSKILALEKTHFIREAKRNDRSAAKSARKRQAQGKAHRQQNYGRETTFIQHAKQASLAPDSIGRESAILGSALQMALQSELMSTPEHPLGQAKPGYLVNPYDPIEEDEIDFDSFGKSISPEARAMAEALGKYEAQDNPSEPEAESGEKRKMNKP